MYCYSYITMHTYDKANQLVSSTIDGKVTHYAYDAAGRLIKEGDKSYAYGWLDKVLSVTENGKPIASFNYHNDGQIAQAIHNGKSEDFLWDGLALIHRGETSFINEPYVTGGNPILSSKDGVMFNDMLGSTLNIGGKAVNMTSFGESADSKAMYTGKPYIGELGYAFLFRNYRSDYGKWQTTDPLGYPDGWNNLAYCNNGVTDAFDLFGANMWELYDKDAAPGHVGHSLPIVTFRNSDGLWCAVGFDYAGGISSGSLTKSKKTSYGATEIDAIMQVITYYNKNQKYEQLTLWNMNNYNSEQAHQKMTYEYEQAYSKTHNCLTITISGLTAGGKSDWFANYIPTSPNDFDDIRLKGQNKTNLLKWVGE